jgi:predicted nuclease of predicted toxin-antitoxin system
MRFLLDANMPRAALRVLIAAGHSATHVRDLDMGSATDDIIDNFAWASGAILVTRDLDFADTRAYPPEASPGRVVLRVSDSSKAEDIAHLLSCFLATPELLARISGHLVVLEPDRVRFRPALVDPGACSHDSGLPE